jgi:hypothetical protein
MVSKTLLVILESAQEIHTLLQPISEMFLNAVLSVQQFLGLYVNKTLC